MKSYQHSCVRNKSTGGYYLKALFLVAISLFLIWGCEGGSDRPKVTVVKRDRGHKPPKPEKNGEKVVDEKREPPYAYNPAGKRDPFQPFITPESKKPASTVPLTPLQRYDVSELKLVGILKGPTGYRALVEDAGGKGFIITKGTPIGRGNGQVKEIHDNRVIIEQTYKDIFGQIERKEISMPLQKPEERGIE